MNDRDKILSLLRQAWDARREGKYKLCALHTKAAHKMCSDLDHDLLGRVYHIYMQIKMDNNEYEEALHYSQQSVSHYAQSHNMNRIAHSIRHLADIQTRLKDYEEAALNYQKAISIYRNGEKLIKPDLTNALRSYGVLLFETGNHKDALPAWEEVKTLYDSYGLSDGVSEAESYLKKLNL